MRKGFDDVWAGLVFGQWLAHERRMQLLGIADEVRLVTQLEAGASEKANGLGPVTSIFRSVRHLFPSTLHNRRGCSEVRR